MNIDRKRAVLGAVGFGAVAGLRSLSAPAWFSQKAARHPGPLDGTPLGWLSHPAAAGVLKLLAGLELAGDKLPGAPNRTAWPGLLARAGAGALVGADSFAAEDESLFQGAVIGAMAAVGATFLSFYLRQAASDRFNIPDPALGVAEDVLVAAAGANLGFAGH